MSLSLDDVRNKRFRMARKSGYEVLEVDEFVDEVEETFAQLVEENQNLKKQVDALKSGAPAPAAAPTPAPVAASKPAPTPAAAPAAKSPVPGAVMVTTSQEASTAVVRLVQLSTEQAERLVAEATDDANRIREEANRSAEQVTADARTRAERVESEARVNAERLQADASGRAEKLDRDIAARRTDMFGDLEQQRDSLVSTVAALREFEAGYRSNLTGHLRKQIASLESSSAEPADPPAEVANGKGASRPPVKDAAGQGQPARDEAPAVSGNSDTPRLDALLGDQR